MINKLKNEYDLNIIIFSKDRACQLELLLRSMIIFWTDLPKYKINVLYTFSNKEYEDGYEKLKNKYKNENFIFHLETNFGKDLRNIFNLKNKYSIFFVDDNVFKEEFILESYEFDMFNDDKENILCLSLRLHPRLSFCYTMNKKMKSPEFDKFRKWDWTKGELDYQYPMSLDAHLFKTTSIYNHIFSDKYNNPNSLESFMASTPYGFGNPIHKNFMICYDKSKVINLPINKVQNYNNNKHGNITQKYLNDKFLSGNIISIHNIKYIDNISCHQEIQIKFENEN
jgi:hypothetical protein